MAKKCKHRSSFKMTSKCKTCKNKKKCYRKIRKNREKAAVATTIVILILAIIGIIVLKTNISKEYAESITIKEVDLKVVQVASKSEKVTEIKEVTRETKEEHITAKTIFEEATSEEVTAEETSTEEVTIEETITDETSTEEITVEEDLETFTESEKIAMGKTVYEEARGECEDGRIAIAAVIINRLKTRSSEYGAENGRIMDVITYPRAFAYPEDMTDEFFKNCPEYEMCMAAVEAAIAGKDPTKAHFLEGARHFYSIIEPLSEEAAAKRQGIDIYVIGNQAFHNDMN